MQLSPEHKQKLRLENIGKKLSQETKDKISRGLKGIKRSQETRGKISMSQRGVSKPSHPISEKHKMILHKKMSGSSNHRWKGDNAGYSAIHHYIRKHWGQPQFCEFCGITNLQGGKDMFHWAMKTKILSRDRVQWLRLCASCHKKYDKKHE